MYETESRSGLTCNPWTVKSSPVLPITVISASGAAPTSPSRKRAAPTPPARTTMWSSCEDSPVAGAPPNPALFCPTRKSTELLGRSACDREGAEGDPGEQQRSKAHVERFALGGAA